MLTITVEYAGQRIVRQFDPKELIARIIPHDLLFVLEDLDVHLAVEGKPKDEEANPTDASGS